MICHEGNTSSTPSTVTATAGGRRRRRCAASLGVAGCLVFGALLALATPASAQDTKCQTNASHSLVTTTTPCIAINLSDGSFMNENAPVAYISNFNSRDFPMPDLTFTLYNAGCWCATIQWDIYISWTDHAGYPQINPISLNSGNLSYGTGSWELFGPAWDDTDGGITASIQAGGTAVVTATTTDFNGNNQVFGYTFQIEGTNNYAYGSDTAAASEAAVDSYYANAAGGHTHSAPWFFGQTLRLESSGHQFVDSGTTSSECGNAGSQIGMPCWGPPDGVGIAQIDRTVWDSSFFNSDQSSPYWDWETNIDDAFTIIDGDTLGAFGFWDSQVSQMCDFAKKTDSGAIYSNNGSGTGACSDTSDIPAATNYAGMSNFEYNPGANMYEDPPSSSQHGYQEAELIVAYNGACNGYYISWNLNASAWQFNYYNPATEQNINVPQCPRNPYDYVGATAKAQPY